MTVGTGQAPWRPSTTLPGAGSHGALQRQIATPDKHPNSENGRRSLGAAERCVSRPAVVLATWRTARAPRERKLPPAEAQSPVHGSRERVREANLSPVRLVLPSVDPELVRAAAAEATMALSALDHAAAKRLREAASRRAESRQRSYLRKQLAATRLQAAWRRRMARRECACRGLARRKAEAKARLARREAEVREEQEQLRRKRADREDAGRARIASAEGSEVGAEAAVVAADLPPPQASYLPLHVVEARLDMARKAWLEEVAVAEEVVTTDATAQVSLAVGEASVQTSVALQDAVCQTDEATEALAAGMVRMEAPTAVAAEMGRSATAPTAVAALEAVTALSVAAPTRSGGRQRKLMRQAKQQRDSARLVAQAVLAGAVGGGEAWQERLEERLEVAQARYQQGVADRAMANFNNSAKAHGFEVGHGGGATVR